jgi:hypothetical protein
MAAEQLPQLLHAFFGVDRGCVALLQRGQVRKLTTWVARQQGNTYFFKAQSYVLGQQFGMFVIL